MSERIIKIGRVEMYESDVKRLYTERKYVVTSYAIYQIMYSQAQATFYGQKVSDIKGMARRGRFYTLTASEINHVLGYEYLAEDIY